MGDDASNNSPRIMSVSAPPARRITQHAGVSTRSARALDVQGYISWIMSTTQPPFPTV